VACRDIERKNTLGKNQQIKSCGKGMNEEKEAQITD
jgi:hypothetical protein